MSKTKSSTTKNITEPVSAPTAAPHPKKEKQTKPKVAKQTDAPKVEETPVKVEPTEEPTVEPAEETLQSITGAKMDLLSLEFTGVYEKLHTLVSMANQLRTELKTIEKKRSRENRELIKISFKKKRKMGARKISGFGCPTLITDELADFLSKPHGTQMARTDVTKELTVYVKENKLGNPKNGREIVPNQDLGKLLRYSQTDGSLTYFNLQRYIKCHFIKETPTEPSV